MRAEPGSPLLSKSAGPRLSGKRTRQLKRLKQLWSSPQHSNPRTHTDKGPEAIDLRAFIRGGDYLGQSILSKTANAPKCGHGGRSISECVGDELLSIARIGAVIKENLREGDLKVVILLQVQIIRFPLTS